MTGKWHILLFFGAVGCLALAVLCQTRAVRLSDQAELEQARSVSSGSSFVDTFSGAYVDSQIGQMDKRRALIASAEHWREGMLFSLVAVVFLAFAGYTVRAVETAFEDQPHAGQIPLPQRP